MRQCGTPENMGGSRASNIASHIIAWIYVYQSKFNFWNIKPSKKKTRKYALIDGSTTEPTMRYKPTSQHTHQNSMHNFGSERKFCIASEERCVMVRNGKRCACCAELAKMLAAIRCLGPVDAFFWFSISRLCWTLATIHTIICGFPAIGQHT